LSAIPVAKLKPTIPEAALMTEAMEVHLSEIVRGKTSPKAGLDSLALDIQRILGYKTRLRYQVRVNQ
jgi:hypothetical protein